MRRLLRRAPPVRKTALAARTASTTPYSPAAPIHAFAASEPGGALAAFQYTPGPLGNTEVDVRVESCGVCHSDVSMLENEWGGTKYPLVPGHEIIGVVGAVGNAVGPQLKVGQRVGLGFHSSYCGACDCCRSGDENLCARAVGTIMRGRGGFADRVRADARALVPIPSSVEAAAAGPLLCAGVTVFNPLLQYGIKPTDRVGVVGIGGLGHLALQFYAKWGCHVTAFTSTPAKFDQAKQLGAHAALAITRPEDVSGAACAFDFVLVTVNVDLDWGAILATVAPRGRLHVVGAVPEPLKIDLPALMDFQRSVSSSAVGSPSTMQTMIDFAARHGIAPVCQQYPKDRINDAIADLKAGKMRFRAVIQMAADAPAPVAKL